MHLRHLFTLLILAFVLANTAEAQQQLPAAKWRQLHYAPQDGWFVKQQGKMRFNRSLYSTNTAFRIEAGDVPEFGLYLPGMGGNIRLAIQQGNSIKWVNDADSIETRYRPEHMQYVLRDKLLGTGSLQLDVLAMQADEGLLMQLTSNNIAADVQVHVVYGGVSGKKFSRDGDIGADPESVWYLQPGYCSGNNIRFGTGGTFTITDHYEEHVVSGSFPTSTSFATVDLTQTQQAAQLLTAPVAINHPVLKASFSLNADAPQWLQWTPGAQQTPNGKLAAQYQQTLQQIDQISERIKLSTPDEWINQLGPVLANAGNAIWDNPTYMHGAVAWRMRLPGWRGANVADPLGWHDRARTHFEAYAKSQIVNPSAGPVVMDTALNLARHQEKIGNAVFSSGYICRNPNGDIRPHHYDMNLVFVDQLLTHFEWTGDTAFVQSMWSLLERHLAWEKRNFDADDDGLYDAYCCIWASDALQYSGGGVAHSSAYNYRAFSAAARLAALIGKDGIAYAAEANKIMNAIQQNLWLADKGWLAEYKDALGHRLVHPAAALWTVYHAIDSKVPDPFQAWQMMQYVSHEIPAIPFKIKGIPDSFLLRSTTNWHPYVWSINNVALGELMHTSLAYWQAGDNEQAFKLWKSSLMESLYCGAGPGAFHQLLSFDAARGELYRDFADPVGVAARTVVEGLFGIKPNVLEQRLLIEPGFPKAWQHASLSVPDIQVSFKRNGIEELWDIHQQWPVKMKTALRIPAISTYLPTVLVNGVQVPVQFDAAHIGQPLLNIELPAATHYAIRIVWSNATLRPLPKTTYQAVQGETLSMPFPLLKILQLKDPQGVLQQVKNTQSGIQAKVVGQLGSRHLFVQVQHGAAIWWQPVLIQVNPAAAIVSKTKLNGAVQLQLKLPAAVKSVVVNGWQQSLAMVWQASKNQLRIPVTALLPGTNHIELGLVNGTKQSLQFIDWQIGLPTNAKTTTIQLGAVLNAAVTDIFQQRYASPRLAVPTLQLPLQGFGQWCYPQATANISDTGLRKKMQSNGSVLMLPNGVSFSVPSASQNIAFTSMWDNYPDALHVPVSGKARHAWLLMAGSTNPMQSRIVNGAVLVKYTDGTLDSLPLINPENWWPIEQDYIEDGYQFARQTPRPPRVHLATGEVWMTAKPKYSSIKGMTNMAIDGGAATVVDIPLRADKTLQSIAWKSISNDVVIGTMAITLLQAD